MLTLNGQGWRTKPRCLGSLCPSSTGTNPSQSPWQGMKPGMKQIPIRDQSSRALRRSWDRLAPEFDRNIIPIQNSRTVGGGVGRVGLQPFIDPSSSLLYSHTRGTCKLHTERVRWLLQGNTASRLDKWTGAYTELLCSNSNSSRC